mmetsp:Transcript_43564/g.68109  ORF Transcript_43564/g.68109 Transcript_43564/m.68109 type:complete len:83 (+) Transcript_43564:822-1070(+)
MVPSSPITSFSIGLTNATEEDPVIPKTQNKTAASVFDSFQCGRFWVVHFQNSSNIDEGLLEPPPPFPTPVAFLVAFDEERTC